MNKTTYLAQPHVREFAKWFGAKLPTREFAHRWTDRRSNEVTTFDSVYDAFQNYSWRFSALPFLGLAGGETYFESASVLTALQGELLSATSDALALRATTAVMRWGGVQAGNNGWLFAHESGLLGCLTATAQALEAGELDVPILTDSSLRFNAGMSKVYSLMVSNFIIYDSRVAAAIAWAVARYCEENCIQAVPADLAFPVARAKEGPDAVRPKCRNPSTETLSFPRLRQGPMHAAWNAKASWLLTETLDEAGADSPFNSETIDGGNPLRALEAALFMLGYDIPSAGSVDNVAAREGAPSEFETKSYTLRRGIEFTYWISLDGIKIPGHTFYPHETLQQLLDVLRADFGNNEFPLANARDRVANNTAQAGFGTVFSATTGRVAQAASQLAAVLFDLGILLTDKSKSPLRFTLCRRTTSVKDALAATIENWDQN